MRGARPLRVSVPGNLLLLGEYAVLEEGGVGLALALEKRLRVRWQPAAGLPGASPGETLVVEGSWPGGSLLWSESAPEASPLVTAVVRACRSALPEAASGGGCGVGPGGAGGGPPWVGGRVSIDSSAFFAAGGRKSGYGSSAAVAVGLAAVLLRRSGLTGAALQRGVLRAALEGHRAAQGGVGSGYDVLASLHGGLGLFRGGREPSWRPVRLPWLPPLSLFRGEHSVATPGAVGRYLAWKEQDPAGARRFLERSNQSVLRFLQAGSWAEASVQFRRLRDLGIEVGERIGAEARLSPPAALACGSWKAIGAGDELGVYVGGAASDGPGFHECIEGAATPDLVILAEGGLQWEA
jgi:phosphomevalonate kinase